MTIREGQNLPRVIKTKQIDYLWASKKLKKVEEMKTSRCCFVAYFVKDVTTTVIFNGGLSQLWKTSWVPLVMDKWSMTLFVSTVLIARHSNCGMPWRRDAGHSTSPSVHMFTATTWDATIRYKYLRLMDETTGIKAGNKMRAIMSHCGHTSIRDMKPQGK